MRRNWYLFFAFFLAAVAVGYYFRGAFGREASIRLVVGIFILVALLKLVQLALFYYVKKQEARMSPAEREEFEKYKRSVTGEDKAP